MTVSAAQLVAEVKATGVSETEGLLKHMGDVIDKTASGFKSMLSNALSFAAGQAVFNLAGNALGFLKDQFTGVLQESMDAQAELQQTVQVLKSTHDASGMTADAIVNLAGSLSHLTMFTDDQIQTGENLLLTFTNIGKKTFPDATQAMLDLSQAMGQDTKTSAIQLGKALNDPLTGMSALQRVGVTFTEDQKKLVKQMMDTGNVAGAQSVILKELQREFGGSAEAAGKTFPGKLAILRQSLDDVRQTIGDALIPILTKLVGWISDNVLPNLNTFANWFVNTGLPAIQNFTQGVWAYFQPVIKLFQQDFIGGFIKQFDFSGIVQSFNNLQSAISRLLGPLADIKIQAPGMDFWKGLETALENLITFGVNALTISLNALATGLNAAKDAINATVAFVQGAISLYNQWKENINGAAAVITLFFIPALIKAGVEGLISGGEITTGFIASMIQTGIQAITNARIITITFIDSLIQSGIEGWIAAAKVWVWITATIASGTQASIAGVAIARQFVVSVVSSGYEAVIAGGKLVASYIAGLIASARQAQLSAATINTTIIPALRATGIAATAAAGVIGIAALAILAAVAGVQVHATLMAKNWSDDTNQMQRSSEISFYNIKSGAVAQMQDTRNKVATHVTAMKNDTSATLQQMVDQSLAHLRDIESSGPPIVQNFSNAVMNVFNAMKNNAIQSLADLDESAKEYLAELQAYLDSANLAADNIAARTGGHNAPNIHAHASGTSFAPGGLSLVGERGPELVVLPRGAQVIPNHQLTGGGGSMSQQPLQIQVDVYLDGARTTRQLMPHIVERIRSSTAARF